MVHWTFTTVEMDPLRCRNECSEDKASDIKLINLGFVFTHGYSILTAQNVKCYLEFIVNVDGIMSKNSRCHWQRWTMHIWPNCYLGNQNYYGRITLACCVYDAITSFILPSNKLPWKFCKRVKTSSSGDALRTDACMSLRRFNCVR